MNTLITSQCDHLLHSFGIRLMKLADHKSQLMYTFQCMNRHIAGLSMFKLQNSNATCKFPTEQEIN